VPEEEIERILGSGVVEAKEFKDCAAIAELRRTDFVRGVQVRYDLRSAIN
jgi:hypothetical protein